MDATVSNSPLRCNHNGNSCHPDYSDRLWAVVDYLGDNAAPQVAIDYPDDNDPARLGSSCPKDGNHPTRPDRRLCSLVESNDTGRGVAQFVIQELK